MGFFSWRTSDTRATIWNRHSGMPTRTTYLLQPNGLTPIAESSYDGYGIFGGIDALEWVGRANLRADRARSMTAAQIRSVGSMMDCGDVFLDTETGTLWSVFHRGAEHVLRNVRHFAGKFDERIPELGSTANELIASGRFDVRPLRSACLFPLKFSFDPEARYEDLPAAENCPTQGFFQLSDA